MDKVVKECILIGDKVLIDVTDAEDHKTFIISVFSSIHNFKKEAFIDIMANSDPMPVDSYTTRIILEVIDNARVIYRFRKGLREFITDYLINIKKYSEKEAVLFAEILTDYDARKLFKMVKKELSDLMAYFEGQKFHWFIVEG